VTDLGDAVTDDEDVPAGEHAVAVVHREHRGVPEQHRTTVGHLVVSHDLSRSTSSCEPLGGHLSA